jgi:hypothetical protein
MSIYFCNDEPIDLNTIRLMGVSVKTGASPIGYFGTGLKYGLATFLRLGCLVKLHVQPATFVEFSAVTKQVRGEEFDVVHMNDEPLGFTTALGRNWEAWQAYREFTCNARDEDGVVLDSPPVPGQYGTVFEVTGVEVERAHGLRDQIFVAGTPLAKTPYVEVYPLRGPHGYYRGVQAKDLSGSTPLFS